jgi:transcriptional regulator with XRE-family HTH domain
LKTPKSTPKDDARVALPSAFKRRLIKWKDKEFRHAYAVSSVEQGVAWQIRANRDHRGLSQKELAERLGTNQSAVSRLEDPEYGAHSLDTLLRLAEVFDCALSVKFISYEQLAEESADLRPERLVATSFDEDVDLTKAS